MDELKLLGWFGHLNDDSLALVSDSAGLAPGAVLLSSPIRVPQNTRERMSANIIPEWAQWIVLSTRHNKTLSQQDSPHRTRPAQNGYGLVK